MKLDVRNAEAYAKFIINDEREKIADEQPVVYQADKIERIYEFTDGAVVRYEWQNLPEKSAAEKYNHRFTLVKPPTDNPHKLKKGTIKTIDY